jgi:DNA-binding PadR family transcriptional regulator
MKRKTQTVEAPSRELTTLEYIILGFLAIKPHSGYDIITNFDVGIYRASASAGSIYPVLKRLETLGLITSVLESVYETRPRKMYSLLPPGESALDEWLRREPTMQEVIEELDIALHKFLVFEFRMSREQTIEWLNMYEQVSMQAKMMQQAFQQAIGNAHSVHTQLINRSIILEIEARLTWIQEARTRLLATL